MYLFIHALHHLFIYFLFIKCCTIPALSTYYLSNFLALWIVINLLLISVIHEVDDKDVCVCCIFKGIIFRAVCTTGLYAAAVRSKYQWKSRKITRDLFFTGSLSSVFVFLACLLTGDLIGQFDVFRWFSAKLFFKVVSSLQLLPIWWRKKTKQKKTLCIKRPKRHTQIQKNSNINSAVVPDFGNTRNKNA